jgi:hypothetical protein
LVFDRNNFLDLGKELVFLFSLGFKKIEFHPKSQEFWTTEEIRRLEQVFGGIRKDLGKLILSKELKLPFMNDFFAQSYSQKRSACPKISLDADGKFYFACNALRSISPLERKKFMIGNTEKGIDLTIFSKKLIRTDSQIDKVFVFSSPKERLVQPFCPFNAFICGTQKKENLPRHMENFKNLSSVYRKFFISMKPEKWD